MPRDIPGPAERPNTLAICIGFVIAYLALSALGEVGSIHGLGPAIWNPAPALGLIFVARLGRVAWLPFVLAAVCGALLFQTEDPPLARSALAAILAGGYIALGNLLKHVLPQDKLLDNRTHLLAWLLLVLGGSLGLAVIHVLALTLAGLLPAEGGGMTLLRHWITNGGGCVILTPLLWCLGNTDGRRRLRRCLANRECIGYILPGLLALGVLLIPAVQDLPSRINLFLLPLLWAGLRRGMAGAMVCAPILQLGLMGALHFFPGDTEHVLELEAHFIGLAILGFLVAVLVEEQRRANDELRQTLRLAAAGEMAGTLAQDLNQPLTALSTYASVCDQLMQRGETGERLRAAIHCVLREAGRVGDAVGHLRGFFRPATTEMETVRLDTLVEAAVLAYRLKAERSGVKLKLAPLPAVPLRADRLQLEVVLHNLLSNALDAVVASPRPIRLVSVSAQVDSDKVCVQVEDSGLGLSVQQANRIFEPFQSTKSTGLGLGLAISRAIVDCHGGRLWGEVANHGIFKLELPLVQAEQ